MAKVNSTFLDIGDPFPNVELKLLSGEKLTLPDDFDGCYGIILFYRGYW